MWWRDDPSRNICVSEMRKSGDYSQCDGKLFKITMTMTMTMNDNDNEYVFIAM